MDQEQDLDLLDLEETAAVDTLPEATPFANPRPKKPWLLMGMGFAIIVLATWIIIARVGGDSGTRVDINLDAPIEKVDNEPAPVANLNVPPKPVEVAPKKPEPAPKPEMKPQPKPIEVAPVEPTGTPVRVVGDRKEVTFNPDKPAVKPVAKPAPKPAPKPVAQKTVSASAGSIYVQFGSYSTRELAQKAEQKIRNAHPNLFGGKQFVVLAAQVKGQTTYRLRIAFQNASDANGFCRNAKSDGLDCYVTK